MAERSAGRHSPLEPLAGLLADASCPAVALREVPFLAQVDVRADADAAAALGLPTMPGDTVAHGERTVLWLGPDEWLAIGPDGDAEAIERELAAGAAAAGAWVTTVDVSANRTAIELTGPRVRELLSKGCSLDLHPRALAPGRCAQTALARAQVILEARGPETFRVHVRSSFATYLATWLADAAAEYA
jgi:sarcosine oxidase subunit gamma